MDDRTKVATITPAIARSEIVRWSIAPRIIKTDVEVCGEALGIQIYRISKTVWVATGEYLGERIEVRDTSPAAAAIGWRQTAEGLRSEDCGPTAGAA
jgi:hypothetical protein